MLVAAEYNKTIDNYSYNTNNVVGKGAFSTVYLGVSLLNGEPVAIKVINLGSLTMDTYQKLQNEIAILKSLPAHPNVVKVFTVLQTVHNVYIVTEHCERKLSKNDNNNMVSVTLGLIDGLRHLYNHNVVHRDLKPDNVLMKNGVPKIIDLGFATTVSGPSEYMTEPLGTPLYMAPEILDRQFYTSKSDVWSLGVMLYELVFKTDPYNALHIEDLKRKIKTSVPVGLQGNSNDSVVNLIKKCLVVDSNQRVSWDKLFSLADKLKRGESQGMTVGYPGTAAYYQPMTQIPIMYY